jgi:hypothetical protein
MDEPAVFQLVKSSTIGIVYVALLAGAKIIGVF